MTGIGRWWRERTSTQRFDLSTRWTMYALLAMPLVLAVSTVSSQTAQDRPVRAWAAALLLAVAAGQTVACGLVLRAALARYLGEPSQPARPVAAAAVLTLVGSAAGSAVLPTQSADPDVLTFGLVVAVSFGGTLAAAAAPMVPSAGLTALVAAAVAASAAAGALTGGKEDAVDAAVYAALWVGLMVATFRFSAWMIGVVWELDRGRGAHARLAVAEERLRFARDLHDVLGRNLSVIAVKSELAGQLARRGDAGAAEEMFEVRQVAHDSLREVRDVVSGYRTADLDAELAGARSVLRSAGVQCRTVGDGSGLPEAIQAALGWVVREATTNVIRHSNATICTIGLDVSHDGESTVAVLRMENDGARPPTPGEDGSGLTGLSERLAGVGGRLTAERRRGDRFVVEARVPAS